VILTIDQVASKTLNRAFVTEDVGTVPTSKHTFCRMVEFVPDKLVGPNHLVFARIFKKPALCFSPLCSTCSKTSNDPALAAFLVTTRQDHLFAFVALF
jgi:hypothetical protein